MGRNLIIALVVGGVVVVALLAWLFPRLASAYGRDKALSRCAELTAQRAALAVQGTDPVTIARLDSEIRACTQTAQSLGADIDLGDVTLSACVSKGEQLSQEFTHYRSTDYADTLKRSNTRQAMLRIGEEMARCYQGAVADSETVATLDKIRAALSRAIGEAELQERCFRDQASGCGRYLGSADTFPPEHADSIRARVILPLRAVHAAATTKRDTLKRSATPAGATPT